MHFRQIRLPVKSQNGAAEILIFIFLIAYSIGMYIHTETVISALRNLNLDGFQYKSILSAPRSLQVLLLLNDLH